MDHCDGASEEDFERHLFEQTRESRNNTLLPRPSGGETASFAREIEQHQMAQRMLVEFLHQLVVPTKHRYLQEMVVTATMTEMMSHQVVTMTRLLALTVVTDYEDYTSGDDNDDDASSDDDDD